MADVIKEFLKLPARILYEGVSFELQLIKNGSNEIRFFYGIDHISINSKYNLGIDHILFWKNPFDHNKNQSFLIMESNISNDEQFLNSIEFVKRFLDQNRLL